jgi:hypothetical protein
VIAPVGWPVVRRILAIGTVLALTGCSGGGSSSTPAGSGPTTVATDPGTSLADVDTTALIVPRAPFCDLVDPAAVTRALGTKPAGAAAYRSGQRTRITADVTDVVHEFGCEWTTAGSSARAWVFVPPVTRQRARALVRAEQTRPECGNTGGDSAGKPVYGEPSVFSECRVGDGFEVAYRGLFGDAWLTCTLTSRISTEPEVAHRADRWCAAVAIGAASAG